MINFKKGICYEEIIGKPDGVHINLTDAGLDLTIYFRNITEEELSNLEGKYKFGLFYKNGVICVLIRAGLSAWMDAPFSVQKAINSKKLSKIGKYSVNTIKNIDDINIDDINIDGEFATTVNVFDTANGELKVLKLVSPQTGFSKKLIKLIKEQLELNQPATNYAIELQKLFNTYQTKELVKYGQIFY